MTALMPNPDPRPASETIAGLLSSASRTADLAAETLKTLVRLGAAIRIVPRLTALPNSAGVPDMFKPHALGDAELIALVMLLNGDPRVRKIETDLDAEVVEVGEAIPHLDVGAMAEAHFRARRPRIDGGGRWNGEQ